MAKWNDPDEKRKITPAVSTPVTLPPSPRQYGVVRPEEPATPSSVPFIRDVTRASEAVASGVGTVAGGLVNVDRSAGNTLADIITKGKAVLGVGGAGIADYFTGSNLMQTDAGPAFDRAFPDRGVAPFVPTSNRVAPTNIPAAAQPFVTPEVTPSPGIAGKTKEQFMGDIAATRETAPVSTPAAEPSGGYRGMVRMGGPEGENTLELPKRGVAPARDYVAELDDVINKVMNDPKNLQTQTMSGGWVKTGGLKKNVLDTIERLRGHQVTAGAGLEGHRIQVGGAKATAEASKLATKEEAALNRAERARAADERIRMDVKELEQRRVAGEDTRLLRERMDKEDKFQKALTKYGEDSITGFNAGKGLFEMGFQGMHADRPEVQQAYLPFKTRLEKALGGRPPTPQQLKMAKEAWYTQMGWTM